MCGRYATTRSAADLSALFESYDETGGRLSPDYNVAPTNVVPVVRMSSSRSRRVLSMARWGLLPPWARDVRVGARMINARAETVATTRSYASSFARRRCLVPADGWYEWVRRERGAKQAYFMTPADGDVLALAGLWSVWNGAAEPVLTCSIITTAAFGELAEVHERMPLVVPPDRWEDWLTGPADPARLLAPAERLLDGIEIRPVGPAVGDVRNNGPELIARVAAAPLGSAEEPVDLTLF
jgi:putative SOS response-associated peptidase YedK